MSKILTVTAATALLLTGTPASPQVSPGELRFREIYKELVETNTSLSAGSCTLAAQRMAARLKAAGFADSQLHLFSAPEHPQEGGLVAIYPGRDAQLKAILLLAHLDVVEAKREDWTRDPFTLVEENGNFYARGAVDDKSEGAIWVDTLMRFSAEHYRPRRTVKLALTCGEETAGAFNGAQWLSENQRELIDAAFALNEGARGELDAAGHRVALEVQAGEKTAQNFRLEVTNPGGHSSLPVKDNAIYHLAAALLKIGDYTFPPQFTDANRAYFTGMAKIQAAGGEAAVANAMRALVRDPADAQAIELVSAKDPAWNSTLRTTCVATMLDAGHATNALPQRARANVNCRIFPGEDPEAVRKTLEKVAADPKVTVTVVPVTDEKGAVVPPVGVPPSPLLPEVVQAEEKTLHSFWPGLPVVPTMSTGATDGRYLRIAGIPTYGIACMFFDVNDTRAHGKDERVGVKDFYDGVEVSYRLIRNLSSQN